MTILPCFLFLYSLNVTYEQKEKVAVCVYEGLDLSFIHPFISLWFPAVLFKERPADLID